MSLSCEFLGANAASEWSVASVYTHVLLQFKLSWSRELLTQVAFESSAIASGFMLSVDASSNWMAMVQHDHTMDTCVVSSFDFRLTASCKMQ